MNYFQLLYELTILEVWLIVCLELRFLILFILLLLLHHLLVVACLINLQFLFHHLLVVPQSFFIFSSLLNLKESKLASVQRVSSLINSLFNFLHILLHFLQTPYYITCVVAIVYFLNNSMSRKRIN